MPTRRQFLAAAAVPLLPVPAAAAPPKFKIGLVTYNVAKDWDLPTILRVCKDVGVAAVECRTTHRHGVEPVLSADDRKRVKGQFADAGVVFWGSGSTCEFHAADPAVVAKNVEECKRFIDLVKALGGTGVKVRPNGMVKGKTAAATVDQIGTALRACGKVAADAGVEIWVEVHGTETQKPQMMADILAACCHKSVGATWNSNPTDVADKSIAAAFDLLKPYIRSCHINHLDNDAKGTYPYRELFGKLKGVGYDRYTLCEVGTAFDPVKGLEYLKRYKATWEKLVGL